MLCNSGGLSKAQIGYIRIEQDRTHIELDADVADQFVAAIGPNRTLEKNIRVEMLDGKPDFVASGKGRKSARKDPSKKPRRDSGKASFSKTPEKAKHRKGKGKPLKARASKGRTDAPGAALPMKKRKGPPKR